MEQGEEGREGEEQGKERRQGERLTTAELAHDDETQKR